MKIKIVNNYSETQNILSGILQGSVLGPLLVFLGGASFFSFCFLIFINDLPNDIESVIKLFADDVKLPVKPLSKAITQIGRGKFSY